MELLHKSYEEFLEEFRDLYDTSYSHGAIHEVFQEHERQRCRKLKVVLQLMSEAPTEIQQNINLQVDSADCLKLNTTHNSHFKTVAVTMLGERCSVWG